MVKTIATRIVKRIKHTYESTWRNQFTSKKEQEDLIHQYFIWSTKIIKLALFPCFFIFLPSQFWSTLMTSLYPSHRPIVLQEPCQEPEGILLHADLGSAHSFVGFQALEISWHSYGMFMDFWWFFFEGCSRCLWDFCGIAIGFFYGILWDLSINLMGIVHGILWCLGEEKHILISWDVDLGDIILIQFMGCINCITLIYGMYRCIAVLPYHGILQDMMAWWGYNIHKAIYYDNTW